MCSGKISDMSSQGIGPQPSAKPVEEGDVRAPELTQNRGDPAPLPLARGPGLLVPAALCHPVGGTGQLLVSLGTRPYVWDQVRVVGLE